MLGNGILEVEIEIRHLKESHLLHKQCSFSFRFKLYGTLQVEVCWYNSPIGGMGRGMGRQGTKACEGEWLCGREKCRQRSSGSLKLQRRRDKALHPVPPSPLRVAFEGRQPPPMPQEAYELSTDPPFLLIKSKTCHCHAAGDIKDCVNGYKAIRNMTCRLMRRGDDGFLRCRVIDLSAVKLIKKKRVVFLILVDYTP